MTEEKVILSKEGYEKLKEELEFLKTQRRAEIAEKIKAARALGDLSENADYDEAKAEQAEIETRISKLEFQIKNASLIEDKTGKRNNKISIGDTVKIKDTKRNKEMTFTIVGTVEADVEQNKISNESPVGQALLGNKKGDTVEVQTRNGIIQYEIVEIVR